LKISKVIKNVWEERCCLGLTEAAKMVRSDENTPAGKNTSAVKMQVIYNRVLFHIGLVISAR
jgi:hypothetical protein